MSKRNITRQKTGFFGLVLYGFVSAVIFIFGILGRKWPRFIEQSSWWRKALWFACTNDFAKESNPSQEADATAVSFFKAELVFSLIIVVLIALPGVSSPWILAAFIFITICCDKVRRVVKKTYGGAKIAFDTGGKVGTFVLFGGLYSMIIAVILANLISVAEKFMIAGQIPTL